MEVVKQLLLDLIKGIVDYPDQVELAERQEADDEGELVIINVKLAKEDVGVCIGRKGSTAEAIRKIVGLVGFKLTGKRVYVKIDAPKIPKDHFSFQK